ncbi:UDP-N-acetylglucosamine--N-acetylmuramyl-(pentapeptide) pyrophosphoryl-undecaprenol N-acetylglucosamine transferase [Protaetiibacter intestinalis]|uniref:UDP-N-acetylglucosamine--N-acetylmuramyl-(pentapeptide) pyrophosphoryl-undecaprenol N-acetylglucosamine transferase n=1 Tax=Protaetiibacter intestinalis TaxID=2419774 RepID=A0A387BDM0_9MICO|nr:UDP-N-acetylglucosamine--N-acetylmuramyl-(pentapeptide) pyrophosphoryl-undecaprenol N-acetylglucosamine transferase [Protaetiibacter intestinalis]AYF99205.1 UDP-N-acetylglucosamine--N-acetylmuramyl-(pentapeptide) pyrophosphoryl-undecaprenol N-acetylglucosamine transferase [Protaetiibacter intestinalis]
MTVYLMAGGGTAGHVNPLLATADRLRELEPDAEVLVLGTAEGLEARLVPQRGYELVTVPRLPFPRRLDADALRFPGRWRASVAATREILRDRGIDAVVGFGGYAAAPAYAAAHREGVPLVIHEANARPGIANRYGARLTRFVGTVFPSTRIRHGRVVGLPLRREIERLDRFAARPEALATLGLAEGRPTLLVTGGSTGARRLNEGVSSGIDAILAAGWQVLHITGSRAPVDDPGLPGYRLLEYCDRMDLALAAADLALSRAGSATVSELAALGIPAVFVPYAVGNGEQRLNAQDAVAAGGALLVADADFDEEWVRGPFVDLLEDPALVADMAARIATTGARDGADRLVELVREAVVADASAASATER